MGTTQHVHQVPRRRRTTCRQRAWKDGVPSGTQGPAGAWSSTCAMMVGLFVLGPQRAWQPHIMQLRAGLKQRLAPVRAVREFLCCVCVILFNLEISVSKEKKAGRWISSRFFIDVGMQGCIHRKTRASRGSWKFLFCLFLWRKYWFWKIDRKPCVFDLVLRWVCCLDHGGVYARENADEQPGSEFFFEKSGLGKWGFYRLGFNGI